MIAGSVNLCQAQNYYAILTSQQEVPVAQNNDTTTYSTGVEATFTLSGTTLATSGIFGNLLGEPNLATGVTIELGPAGVQGSPLFDIPVTFETPEGGGLYFGTFSGSVTLTGPEIAELNNFGLYLNITTPTQNPLTPGGEVRGQIVPVPEPATMTLMGVGSLAWLAIRRRKA